MKDLFDTITSNERKRQRTQRVRRQPGEELVLEGDALYDAMGGTYSDRSFFDLDHAIAASGRSRTRGSEIEELDLIEADMVEEY